jgi:hypothetical protein
MRPPSNSKECTSFLDEKGVLNIQIEDKLSFSEAHKKCKDTQQKSNDIFTAYHLEELIN